MRTGNLTKVCRRHPPTPAPSPRTPPSHLVAYACGLNTRLTLFALFASSIFSSLASNMVYTVEGRLHYEPVFFKQIMTNMDIAFTANMDRAFTVSVSNCLWSITSIPLEGIYHYALQPSGWAE